MGKETVLKKDFQKKDVERLRNLMQGKYGEKTRSSVGFSKSDTFYDEGDIWEADGRSWTIVNGIKQNITKLDKAKKAHNMPLFCPDCKKLMKRVDKPYYNVHKFCLDCFAKFEDKLKTYVKEQLEEENNSFVSEDGDVENWVGKLNVDKVEEFVKSTVEYLEGLKTKK